MKKQTLILLIFVFSTFISNGQWLAFDNTWLNINKPDLSKENGIRFFNAGKVDYYLYCDNGNNSLKIQATGLSGEGDATPRIELPRNNKNLYFVQSGGNVGIGLNNPTTNLHVKGTGSTWIGIDRPNTSTESGLRFMNSGAVDFYLYTDNGNNSLKIQATDLNGEGDATPRIEIPRNNKNIYFVQSGGNVGIGTTDPKAKLSVEGTIASEEVRVLPDISQYPDFVFADDYKLRPIKEVEDYILKNKHLPEIPKAEEVKDGIALGEMNSKLLQKIEELTLYIIEQNKEIEKLKERLDNNGIE